MKELGPLNTNRVLWRAHEKGLRIERDPKDLERYPEHSDEHRRFYRITLQGDDYGPPRQWIDVWTTPVSARYYLYGVTETMKENSNERTVLGWVERYGEPVHVVQ